jgi:hypothetical protein
MSIVHLLPRPIRFLTVILMALLALGVSVPAGAHAAPQAASARFAAIAYSPSADHWATTEGYSTRDRAKDKALLLCFQKARGCRIAASMQNGYAALAVSRNGAWAGGVGYTLLQARNAALARCNQYGGVRCYIETTVSSWG